MALRRRRDGAAFVSAAPSFNTMILMTNLARRRGFNKIERRCFCRCELCRLAYGRLLYPMAGGEPLGLGRLPGFDGNF